jgi:hypothetical protein
VKGKAPVNKAGAGADADADAAVKLTQKYALRHDQGGWVDGVEGITNNDRFQKAPSAILRTSGIHSRQERLWTYLERDTAELDSNRRQAITAEFARHQLAGDVGLACAAKQGDASQLSHPVGLAV